MLDILDIQTFPIAPTIEKLQAINLDLSLLNGKLNQDKQFYEVACVILVLSISVYVGYNLLIKTNKETK